MNPVLREIEKLRAEGLPVSAVRIERRGPAQWEARISIPHFLPIGEGDGSCGPAYSVTIDPPPPGVSLAGWERHPDHVVELSGSEEQVEALMSDVARQGQARDSARFDADAPGYPHFLTKPNRWLPRRLA